MVSGEYSRPYEAHAAMCPPTAVAHVTPARVDVWGFTQDVSALLRLSANQAGRDTKDVFVHATYQGGAFEKKKPPAPPAPPATRADAPGQAGDAPLPRAINSAQLS
jgi:isoquinoline 1-oxidoreductase beta subunit